MDDADLVRQVAAEYIDQMGATALSHLKERADHAVSIGDIASAIAWLDIAAAAATILSNAGS